MPYPAQVNREQIVTTAHAMLETHGYEAVSLAKLAGELGIKAPSLYKHLADKTALLRAVNTLTYERLVHAMTNTEATTPYERLLAMADGYRAYALAHPVTYSLAFDTVMPDAQPDPAMLEQLALPLQSAFNEAMGGDSEERALMALRGAWALLHGFVALEVGAQFKRGGDLEATFQQVMVAYLRGWGITAPS
jgi:AcrR family transcriptional regulator